MIPALEKATIILFGVVSLGPRISSTTSGGFFVRSHNKPSTEETLGIRAIHKDVLRTVSAGKEVWSDAGTGARKDGAVWDISVAGHLNSLNPGAFIPVEGHNNRPQDAYAINQSKVRRRVRFLIYFFPFLKRPPDTISFLEPDG